MAAIDPTLIAPSATILAEADPRTVAPPLAATVHTALACFHCGESCAGGLEKGGKAFCCQGCLVVHDLLAENGMGQYYDLRRHPGIRAVAAPGRARWACLDDPSVKEGLLDFTDGKMSRITLRLPAIHCVACVWLLENLFRLHSGIGQTQVNFPKREATITFAPEQIPLSEVAELLTSIGYEPHLTLGALDQRTVDPARKRQWLQIGIAGFAFGNVMLFSLPLYFGLDSRSGPGFRTLFGYLSLILAAPVLVYSAADYWRAAFLAVRRRILTLDVPIALGLAAVYAQSAWDILTERGGGYLDSMAGLVFFLLCGRMFQQVTHERMAFDRDYKCFFPLSATRKTAAGEASVALSQLLVGDRLLVRHGELIPADARLLTGEGLIDYSFVTGESEAAPKEAGAYLYAGGRQVGGAIEVETVKPVSQSYLTSLWDHEAFRKDRRDNLNTLTNRYSRRFTRIVLVVAVGAGLAWLVAGQAERGLKAFASVLIVACPCALALAAPFTLGTAQRLLARLQIFLKNALVLERMAQVDAIVFDKTGTLTAASADVVKFLAAEEGGPGGGGSGDLSLEERAWVRSLAGHSTHPHSVRLCEALAGDAQSPPATGFTEIPGHGIQGLAGGHHLRLGSPAWLAQCSLAIPPIQSSSGSVVCLAIDGQFRGRFILENSLRPETEALLRGLGCRYELALLSGDNEKERARFQTMFGPGARVHFNQSPLDKLGFIQRLQESGRTVMMVGDGLNDAGALRQSDVGVAVVEQVGAFSPASDVILAAGRVPRLVEILGLARQSARIVRLSFGISAAYNLAGVSVAALGILSPLICAVLMPLSSISVVLFACGATRWAAARAGLLVFGQEVPKKGEF